MKTKLLSLLGLLIIFSAFSFRSKTDKDGLVMIYGVVYTTACKSSETYQHYEYKVVSEAVYNAEATKMKLELQKTYPAAKRIKVSSSKFDFGNSATDMCILKWTNTNNGCSYDVVWVQFGTSEQDAVDRAVKHKKEWADNKANYVVLVQKKFVR